MNGPALWLAGALLLSSSTYSCHKPTTEEPYSDAKHCHAVYDATLAIVPAARFKLAGLDPVIVREASTEHMESAHVLGRRLGMNSVAIFQDTMHEKAMYLRAHSGPGNANAKFDALRKDVNQCLGDDFGRYND